MARMGKRARKRILVRPIHPFPARMAASIAFDELRRKRRPLRVLDPMVGSGTTLVVAKSRGHQALGFDTDPMAVLLAKAWCLNTRENAVRNAADRALKAAMAMARRIKLKNAYPCSKKDKETRAFVRYWFDATNRRQLTALSRAIRSEADDRIRTLLWCALSRMIITKQASVSLAMDLAHSRPHRVRDRSLIRPFDKFLGAIEILLAAAPFGKTKITGRAEVRLADARKLPLRPNSIDLVITSPPYLNAIDYLRCHKFSLVWMGHSIRALRNLRATNIGTEVGLHSSNGHGLDKIAKRMTGKKQLPSRHRGMLKRYIVDMKRVIREIARVLVPGGRATFIVGNSTVRGVFIKNSIAISIIGQQNGLQLISAKSRILPSSRRYLPPPSREAGAIHKRMRTEVVITLRKFCSRRAQYRKRVP